MKKKLILIMFIIFASLFVASCDKGSTNVEKTIHERGIKDLTPSDIKLPEALEDENEEIDNPVIPDNPVTPDEPINPVTPTKPEGKELKETPDETIEFDGDVVETEAGTGYSEILDDGEILYATTNIGYEFLGWCIGNKVVSLDSFYRVRNGEEMVSAKYKIKDEFKYFEFVSTPNECIITGVKSDAPGKLIIPEGVTKINSYAFNNCGIALLSLPTTLNEIEDFAFSNSKIISITFNSVPKNIGDGIAYNSKIYEIFLPKADDDFNDLKEKLNHDDYLLSYKTIGDISDFVIINDFLFSYWEGEWSLLNYLGNEKNIILPDKNEEIEEYYIEREAFKNNCNIETVIIPDAVNYISNEAFSSCKSLKHVEIGKGVTDISEFAFYHCDNLKEVVLSEGLKTIQNSAFANCTALEQITLPSTLENIYNSAFYDCKNLFVVYNLSNLNIIKGDYDYGYVAYFAAVVLNNNEESPINVYKDFKYFIDKENNTVTLLKYLGESQNVEIPLIDDYKIILGERLFSGRLFEKPLCSIVLNENVVGILDNAFEDTDIEVFDGLNVETVGENAFQYCEKLKSVSLPKVKDLSNMLFYQCYNLKEVNIPIVERIGEASFYENYNLTDIVLPNTLKKIDSSAFYLCKSLYCINLPQSLVLSDIGYSAFNYCYNLVEIINETETAVTTGSGSFGGLARNALSVISDPKDSILKVENGFVTFIDTTNENKKTLINYQDENASKIEIPNDIEVIRDFALYGTSVEELNINTNFSFIGSIFGARDYSENNRYVSNSLKKVVLGDNFNTLKYDSFYGCKNIKELEFGKNLVDFETEAFVDTNIESVYYRGSIDDWVNINFETLTSNPLYNGCDFYILNSDKFDLVKELEISNEVNSIGNYQFAGFSIENVKLSDAITSIGIDSFKNCLSLKTINIPNLVTEIKSGAFYNCGLESITLPITLTNLEEYAFSKNNYLKSVVIPGSISCIEAYLFSECINLQYVEIKDGITEIKENAFSKCRSLYTVVIPDSLTTIGYAAFMGCETIEDIDLSKTSVSVISGETFKNCKNLENINFSLSLISIDSTSFEGCNKLNFTTYKNGNYFGTKDNPYKWLVKARAKTIVDCTVHPDCEKIYDSAFSECAYLKKLIIPSTCTDFNSILYGLTRIEYIELPYIGTDRIGYMLFGVNNDSIPKSLKTVVINGGTLAESAFYNCSTIKRIDIDGDVKEIPNYTFEFCTSLTNVNILSDVTSIGNYAFQECGIVSFTALSTMNSIGTGAFKNCNSLTTIDLSSFNASSTFSISSSAFEECAMLTSVTLPDNMILIPSSMFKNCELLTSITIPDTVKNIGAYTFYGTGLTSISLNNVIGLDNYSFANTKLEAIELGMFVTSVGTYTFQNCKNLTSAILRYKTGTGLFDGCDNLSSVTIYRDMTIEQYAFRNCISLKSIDLTKVGNIAISAFENSGLTSVSAKSGITIGDSAFKNCKELEAASFTGTSKNTFGTSMFAGCSKLTTVTWPSNVTVVPTDTFKDCELLSSFDFDKVEIIGVSSFENTGFTSITLPDTISYIETASFSNCLKLSSLQINCKLTRSGNNPPERMFAGCKALKTVVMNNDDDFIPWEAFKDCSSLDTFTYGTNVTEIKESAFYGCGFDTLNIPSKVTTVGNKAFAYNKFTELSIPSTISTLGSYAFAYNKALTKVVLNYIDNISSDIFYQCSNLTDVTLPSGLETITSYMFGYTALKSITLPVSIKKIESYAFINCSSLETITIPRNVTSIGTSAFQNCTSLSIVKNYSELNIEAGSTSYGYVGYYAKTVESPFADESNFVEDENGYKFAYVDGKGYLMGYEGNNTALSLPESFEFNHEIIEEYEIFSNAFAGMNIIKITIPNNVTAIWDGAFDECVKLVEVYNYSSLDILQGEADNGKVGYYALVIHNAQEDSIIVEDANGFLLTKYTDNNTTIGTVIGYVGPETEITIPTTFTFGSDEINVKTIYDNAFVGTSITSVIIPDGITNIGSYAFKNIKSLEEIVVPSNVECGSNPFASCSIVKATIPTSMIKYINYTDANNTKLEEVTINGGTSIDANAFKDCGKLTKVVLPNTIETIGTSAFEECSSLSNINLPNSLTSIGNSVFKQCKSLKGIIIPESLTIISEELFYYSSLQYIVLPKTITTIKSNAFAKNDAKGMDVLCLGTESEFSSITIRTYYSTVYGYTYATKYYYSEDEPTVSNKYWHYVDGVPTIWVI